MRYTKSWTEALQEVQEQVGVRKVDFVDGVTPDLQEAKPEFEVKYASSKKGPIKVSKFMSLEDAKKFLAQIKKEGMNGIISKGGKPVKEEDDVDEASKEVKDRVKMFKKLRDKKSSQGFQPTGLKNEHHEKDANGEPIPHDDEEGLEEARKSYDDVEMRKKLKTPKHANRKTAGDEKRDRETARRKKLGILGPNEEVEINEADYELYHKDFSSAMQHAYAHAKKKGFTVDPEEIDNKVATGPKKPSKGKTNRYILGTDKKKKVHIQVANLDNKKFELNMYIEETEKENMDINETIRQVLEGKVKVEEGMSGSDVAKKMMKIQTMKAFAKKVAKMKNVSRDDLEKMLPDYVSGSDITKVMEDASNDKSDDGEGMDKVDSKALKKKFKDRKDKDIDNDGDTDDSDEYLHKKRKAVDKAIKNESDDEQKGDYGQKKMKRAKEPQAEGYGTGKGGMTTIYKKKKNENETLLDKVKNMMREKKYKK